MVFVKNSQVLTKQPAKLSCCCLLSSLPFCQAKQLGQLQVRCDVFRLTLNEDIKTWNTPHPPLAQPVRPSPIPTDLINSLECLHSSLIQLDTMIREMNKVISGVNGMLLKGGDREDPAGAWKKPSLRGRSEGSGPSCLAGWKGHQRAGQAQGNNKTNPLSIKTSHAGLARVLPQKLLITHISHIKTLLFRLSAIHFSRS